MRAFLYKLRFETAVHFGAPDSALSLDTSEDHFCADTLFSALCHTANAIYGPDAAAALCEEAKAGNLLLTDSMPWTKSASGTDTLFLPRPMMVSQTRSEIDPARRKAVKKLNWIPVASLESFAASVQNGTEFDISGIPKVFGRADVTERASVSRKEGEDANPYSVGVFRFYQGREGISDCGLYFIALFQREEWAVQTRALLQALGATGIGGKISSGYGKFSLVEAIDLDMQTAGPSNAQTPEARTFAPIDTQTIWLRNALRRKDGGQLLLTASLPRPEEMETVLDGAYFQLIRRAGFVHPADAEKQGRKKRTQYFLTAGSVLRRRFSGDVYPAESRDIDLTENDEQQNKRAGVPVLRYGRPVFLGVS